MGPEHGAFERDYQFAQAARNEEILPVDRAGDVPGLSPRQRQGRHAQLCRHPHLGELLGHRRRLHRRGDRALRHPRRLSQHRRRHRAQAGTGCVVDYRGDIFDMLKRTTWGYATNPNMGGVLMVGLGCEGFQIPRFKEAYGVDRERDLPHHDDPGDGRHPQDGGGRRRGGARPCCRSSNKARRETMPASELTLALQCGGSDGYSGITANPALGVAADILVRHGGTAILSETPEIYGAEHLLTRRAAHARGRREARRHHPVVGGLHRPQQHGDEQQSFARQQGSAGSPPFWRSRSALPPRAARPR